jgi:two-component system CheB/CheR fusion protein
MQADQLPTSVQPGQRPRPPQADPGVRWQRFRGLAFAAAGYLLAAALTWGLWGQVFHRAPFPLFIAASAIAAWAGGFWLGLGTALLGAITVSALVGAPTPEIVAASLVMVGVATLVSYLAERSREAESEIDEAGELLNTVLDQAPIGIALFDRELRFIRLNDALARIDGLPAEAHLGKTVSEALPGVGADLEAALRHVLGSGEPVSLEVTGETPAAPGEQRHWSVYAYALRLRGEVIGASAVCEEITGKRRAREELRQAKETAEAASEAKDHFLAALSHELRTPLTPVLAIASVLEEEPRLPGYARQQLAVIRRNVELEARLIDDLLDLTRIERGKIELHLGPADARQLLEDALHTCCQQDIDSGRVKVTWNLAAASHQVRADALRLSQVFWNLLRNAIKFTPDGGSIHVATRDEDGQLVVTVTDSGIGIEPARLAHIFDAFEQGDPAVNARFGGLGIGLAISRAIVELHGGTIGAASDGRHRGATFAVRLPLDPGSRAEAEEVAVGAGEEEAAPAGSRGAARTAQEGAAAPAKLLRILLVEDHADTAAAMAELLSGLGHKVTVAGGMAAALAAVERRAAGNSGPALDLVISDLGLPDGNGHELMRKLSRRYGLKGIALSGYGMEDDREKSLQAGFSRHLTKPVQLRALQAVIREVAATD